MSFWKDPNEILDIPVKLYGCPELVVEVCQERRIYAWLTKFENDFIVITLRTTRGIWRDAQREWVRRMMVSSSQPLPLPRVKVDPIPNIL